MRFLLLPLVSLVVFVSGCESMSSRVRDRFEPVPPKTRAYTAEQRTVFDAAQAAMRTLDFEVTRARPNEGVLNAMSHLMSGDTFGAARQYRFEVRVAPDDSGRIVVSALLHEEEESSSFKGATDLEIREHGLYDSFFAALEQALRARGVATDPAK